MWQARLLGVTLITASVLQWYWGMIIVKGIVRKVRGKSK